MVSMGIVWNAEKKRMNGKMIGGGVPNSLITVLIINICRFTPTDKYNGPLPGYLWTIKDSLNPGCVDDAGGNVLIQHKHSIDKQN